MTAPVPRIPPDVLRAVRSCTTTDLRRAEDRALADWRHEGDAQQAAQQLREETQP